MKKKIKLKVWVKFVITLILGTLGIVIYHYLSFYGAYMGKNVPVSIFILVGWFWLIIGQIMMLYVMWEN